MGSKNERNDEGHHCCPWVGSRGGVVNSGWVGGGGGGTNSCWHEGVGKGSGLVGGRVSGWIGGGGGGGPRRVACVWGWIC